MSFNLENLKTRFIDFGRSIKSREAEARYRQKRVWDDSDENNLEQTTREAQMTANESYEDYKQRFREGALQIDGLPKDLQSLETVANTRVFGLDGEIKQDLLGNNGQPDMQLVMPAERAHYKDVEKWAQEFKKEISAEMMTPGVVVSYLNDNFPNNFAIDMDVILKAFMDQIIKNTAEAIQKEAAGKNWTDVKKRLSTVELHLQWLIMSDKNGFTKKPVRANHPTVPNFTMHVTTPKYRKADKSPFTNYFNYDGVRKKVTLTPDMIKICEGLINSGEALYEWTPSSLFAFRMAVVFPQANVNEWRYFDGTKINCVIEALKSYTGPRIQKKIMALNEQCFNKEVPLGADDSIISSASKLLSQVQSVNLYVIDQTGRDIELLKSFEGGSKNKNHETVKLLCVGGTKDKAFHIVDMKKYESLLSNYTVFQPETSIVDVTEEEIELMAQRPTKYDEYGRATTHLFRCATPYFRDGLIIYRSYRNIMNGDKPFKTAAQEGAHIIKCRLPKKIITDKQAEHNMGIMKRQSKIISIVSEAICKQVTFCRQIYDEQTNPLQIDINRAYGSSILGSPYHQQLGQLYQFVQCNDFNAIKNYCGLVFFESSGGHPIMKQFIGVSKHNVCTVGQLNAYYDLAQYHSVDMPTVKITGAMLSAVPMKTAEILQDFAGPTTKQQHTLLQQGISKLSTVDMPEHTFVSRSREHTVYLYNLMKENPLYQHTYLHLSHDNTMAFTGTGELTVGKNTSEDNYLKWRSPQAEQTAAYPELLNAALESVKLVLLDIILCADKCGLSATQAKLDSLTFNTNAQSDLAKSFLGSLQTNTMFHIHEAAAGEKPILKDLFATYKITPYKCVNVTKFEPTGATVNISNQIFQPKFITNNIIRYGQAGSSKTWGVLHKEDGLKIQDLLVVCFQNDRCAEITDKYGAVAITFHHALGFDINTNCVAAAMNRKTAPNGFVLRNASIIVVDEGDSTPLALWTALIAANPAARFISMGDPWQTLAWGETIPFSQHAMSADWQRQACNDLRRFEGAGMHEFQLVLADLTADATTAMESIICEATAAGGGSSLPEWRLHSILNKHTDAFNKQIPELLTYYGHPTDQLISCSQAADFMAQCMLDGTRFLYVSKTHKTNDQGINIYIRHLVDTLCHSRLKWNYPAVIKQAFTLENDEGKKSFKKDTVVHIVHDILGLRLFTLDDQIFPMDEKFLSSVAPKAAFTTNSIQGVTLRNVRLIIDPRISKSPRDMYVALSRNVTIDGIYWITTDRSEYDSVRKQGELIRDSLKAIIGQPRDYCPKSWPWTADELWSIRDQLHAKCIAKYKVSYEDKSNIIWDLDHIRPCILGGQSTVDNLQFMPRKDNKDKSCKFVPLLAE